MIYAADIILPISNPPIANGAVLVTDGRINAVGVKDELLAANPGEEVIEFADAILMPGLVNLHGHLECSSFDFLAKPTPFSEWVGTIIQAGLKMQRDDWLSASRAGVKKYFVSGITCTADITRSGVGLQAVAEAGMPALVYLEAVGIDDRNLTDAVVDLLERVKSAQSILGVGDIKVGLSPHSVYSLSKSALKVCNDISLEYGLPLSIHLTETQAEVELICSGTGSLASTIGKKMRLEVIKQGGTGKTPAYYLNDLGLVRDSLIAAHGVWLSDRDIALLQEKGSAVAVCPTSNELLGSGEAPIKQFIEHGLEFGLGTDSPASNPDMDLFVEARKARAILEKQLGQAKPQSEVSAALSPKRLIEMMTLGAARILGFADDLGSIDPGKRADFIILNHQDTASDPYDYLIETASKSLISQTILSGNIVYNR